MESAREDRAVFTMDASTLMHIGPEEFLRRPQEYLNPEGRSSAFEDVKRAFAEETRDNPEQPSSIQTEQLRGDAVSAGNQSDEPTLAQASDCANRLLEQLLAQDGDGLRETIRRLVHNAPNYLMELESLKKSPTGIDKLNNSIDHLQQTVDEHLSKVFTLVESKQKPEEELGRMTNKFNDSQQALSNQGSQLEQTKKLLAAAEEDKRAVRQPVSEENGSFGHASPWSCGADHSPVRPTIFRDCFGQDAPDTEAKEGKSEQLFEATEGVSCLHQLTELNRALQDKTKQISSLTDTVSRQKAELEKSVQERKETKREVADARRSKDEIQSRLEETRQRLSETERELWSLRLQNAEDKVEQAISGVDTRDAQKKELEEVMRKREVEWSWRFEVLSAKMEALEKQRMSQNSKEDLTQPPKAPQYPFNFFPSGGSNTPRV